MKTILVINQKGGSAKSITSYHLAYFLAEKSSRILFIDSDTQGNSTTSLRRFQCELQASQFFSDKPIVFPVNANPIMLARADNGLRLVEGLDDNLIVERVRARLAEAEKFFDYCVIDSPGANAKCVAGFLMAATHTLVPTEIDSYGVNVAVTVLKRIVGVQQHYNKNLVNLGLLPSRLKAGALNQRKDLEALMRSYGQYVLPACIVERIAYKEAADEGVPVWEYTKRQKRGAAGDLLYDEKKRPLMERVSNEAAAKEILAAFDLIFKKIAGHK